MSALLQPPSSSDQLAPAGVITDHDLVAAVRRGDDRAFETLYERYHRRIHAYVFGMVKDHQRAEDVTQEVFVSALRRMRATERPIAFKPWVYEIAKNACIDQFRRSKRAEEISYDADDGLAPGDYGRLVSREPVPDAAVAAKQQLDHLCGAFGGLSDAHHKILVLRELEGLSYREIGERMGMSRPAVESTLFRARRRLSEEYDELASGERCLRIQSIISGAGSGRLGARDTRRLARHVAHCQPCRRMALAAGVVDPNVAARPLHRRAIDKVAALFPFPLLLRGRRGGSGSDGWVSQLPVVSDHAAAGGAKLAAVAALVVAGLGAGVGTHVVPVPGSDSPTARPAKSAVKAPSSTKATRSAAPGATRSSSGSTSNRSAERSRASKRSERSPGGARTQTPSGGVGGTGVKAPSSGGGGNVPAASVPGTGSTPSTPSTGSSPKAPSVSIQLPAVTLGSEPTNTVDTGAAVQQVGDAVQQTTQQAGDAVQQTTQQAGDAVQQTTDGLVQGLGG